MKQYPRFTDSEIMAESKVLLAQTDNPWAKFEARCGRVIIRTLRIMLGLLLFLLALYFAGEAWETLNTPFAAQSFAGILGGLGMVILTWFAGTWAWGVAFGKGPTRGEQAAELRNLALQSLTVKHPAGKSIASKTDSFD